MFFSYMLRIITQVREAMLLDNCQGAIFVGRWRFIYTPKAEEKESSPTPGPSVPYFFKRYLSLPHPQTLLLFSLLSLSQPFSLSPP